METSVKKEIIKVPVIGLSRGTIWGRPIPKEMGRSKSVAILHFLEKNPRSFASIKQFVEETYSHKNRAALYAVITRLEKIGLVKRLARGLYETSPLGLSFLNCARDFLRLIDEVEIARARV